MRFGCVEAGWDILEAVVVERCEMSRSPGAFYNYKGMTRDGEENLFLASSWGPELKWKSQLVVRLR